LYSAQGANVSMQNIFVNNACDGLNAQQHEMIQKQIKLKELTLAIKQLKKGKSPGPDGISNEFYIFFFKKVKEPLLKTLNYIYQNNKLNEQFSNGVVTLVHKKGDPSKIENYRPITLLNCDYELLSRILNNRIKPTLKQIISEQQHAAPGLSTHTATIVIRDAYDEAQKSKTDSFFVAVDFRKAFDSINHDWLIRVLKKKNFPDVCLKFMKSIYSKSFSTIKINQELTKPFVTQRGVRQGDPMSPTLFIIALDPLLRAVQENKYITPSPNPVKLPPKIVAYADDLTLTISKTASLPIIKSILEDFHKASGLI